MENEILFEKLVDLAIKKNNEKIKDAIIEYNIKLKYLYSMKDLEIKNEPLKFFPLSHKKWEKNIKTLNEEINNTYKIINDELNEIIKAYK